MGLLLLGAEMSYLKNISLVVLLIISTLFSADNQVYKIPIDGTIDNGLPPYVKRSIQVAEANNAAYILFEINTFGGRVDAATAIKDAIMNSKVPTVAFINKRAISAGSLIALSCNKIIMAPGSSMGATTVVDESGKKQSEKSQSFMRAEMGSTAEKNGRDKLTAEAMVDEDIDIPGLVPKGKLLTLTALEALKHNMCDTILTTEKEIYSYLQISQPEQVVMQISAAENIVRFLTHPIVSSLLMTLGFLGLIFEIKTPGWGVGGTVGLVALTLFFGSHYIIDMAGQAEILIFIGGILLLLLEIFVIPGFGFAGVIGILAVLLSFFMTMLGRFPRTDDFVTAGATISASFILSMVGLFFIVKYLPDSKFFSFLIVKNKTHSAAAVASDDNLPALVGLSGKTETALRLSGKAEFNGKEYQVISRDEFIDKGEIVQVEKVEGNKIVVIKKHDPT